jgi:hypothetical protein
VIPTPVLVRDSPECPRRTFDPAHHYRNDVLERLEQRIPQQGGEYREGPELDAYRAEQEIHAGTMHLRAIATRSDDSQLPAASWAAGRPVTAAWWFCPLCGLVLPATIG